jgi:hypothetical protein
MSNKDKELCDWKKGTYLDDVQLFKSIVTDFRYACKKCGRVAKDKKWLCKSVKIVK